MTEAEFDEMMNTPLTDEEHAMIEQHVMQTTIDTQAARLHVLERLVHRALLWVVDLMASYQEPLEDLSQWYADARVVLGMMVVPPEVTE